MLMRLNRKNFFQATFTDGAGCLIIRQGAKMCINNLAKSLKLVVTPALPKKSELKQD